ncbi:DUF4097 family beta strand repeat-containing protein [Luedemannella helvata]|uniref:DUF4097 family beta strand repeat-containing protein n=1 Tax=Luedemannella helvata TaxID=349315 RepID=A0ABP4WRM1_9ACTN
MTAHHNQYEFPTASPLTAVVKLGAGLITVTAEERASAGVTVTPIDDNEAGRSAAERTKVELRGDELLVEAPDLAGGWPLRRGAKLRVEVRMPVGSSLRARSGSSDVRCEGQLRDVSLQSGSGDLTLGEATGEVSATTGSGGVNAGTVGGSLRVITGSGDVAARWVGEALSVNSASGDVSVGEVAGSVNIKSAAAEVRLGAVRADVKINTASGDVVLGVPAGTPVWLDLHSLSGDARSELTPTGAPASGQPVRLQVRSLSGTIRVHTAVPTAAS